MSVSPDQYRKKCIDEHGEVCEVCGSGGDVHVHHIDGDRSNNELENLIPLCPGCHRRVHRASYPGDNERIMELRNKSSGAASSDRVETRNMARKQRVNLSLSQPVLDRLDDEENMSRKVESLLREEYDL